MINKCIICGQDLNENNICPNAELHYKPMCLNCKFCESNSDKLICNNEENKQDAVNKIKKSFEGGYEIVDINLAPLPLKEPTRKCKRHCLNVDLLIEEIRALEQKN